MSGGDYWQQEIAEALRAKYPDLKIPTEVDEKETPDFGNAGRSVDNTRSKEVLGIQYHSLSDTVCDMAEVLIKKGMVQIE